MNNSISWESVATYSIEKSSLQRFILDFFGTDVSGVCSIEIHPPDPSDGNGSMERRIVIKAKSAQTSWLLNRLNSGLLYEHWDNNRIDDIGFLNRESHQCELLE